MSVVAVVILNSAAASTTVDIADSIGRQSEDFVQGITAKAAGIAAVVEGIGNIAEVVELAGVVVTAGSTSAVTEAVTAGSWVAWAGCFKRSRRRVGLMSLYLCLLMSLWRIAMHPLLFY